MLRMEPGCQNNIKLCGPYWLYCPLREPLSGMLFHANNKILEILQLIYLIFCNNTGDEMAHNAQNVSPKQSGFLSILRL